MGIHLDRPVAAKVLRVYSTCDLDKVTRVGFSFNALHNRVGKLTVTHVEVLQGSCDVEKPSPSKRATAVGSDDGQ